MVTVCFARLRSNVRYREPLHDIMDSFYYMIDLFIRNHKDYNYTFYNITFDGSRPLRNLTAIEKADIIIIPSEAEFRYHIPGGMHPKDLAKSNQHIADILPYVQGKKLIILRSDRADNEELYRKLFGDNFVYDEIDEIDFDNNIHGLKYHFIQDYQKRRLIPNSLNPYQYDFMYWGWDKRKDITGKDSGDERHKVLKQIKKGLPEGRSLFVGYFSNFQRDLKGMDMYDLIPYMEKSRTTLCFNWKSNIATTSRYVEALATGIFPFVWKDYDSTNTLVMDDAQRVWSVNEYFDSLRKKGLEELFLYIKSSFEKNLPSKQEYYDDFASMLKGKL